MEVTIEIPKELYEFYQLISSQQNIAIDSLIIKVLNSEKTHLLEDLLIQGIN